ncbi:MAG: hypothetical protein CVU47_00665 [Chloroflexi bacterium HGW-Chloroflexi-9]|nr:MAG: hypothetical protein CVU47_00665 [Chloroflexi bacterium HGW-Chloroflexi-9]
MALSAAALVLSAACGGADEKSDATPTEVSPAATATATAATPAETATATPDALAALNGLACTGGWRNETFGSTGSFAATFHVEDGGGRVALEVGGNVFGGTGGTVDAPFTRDGDSTVFDVDLGFLGQAMFRFNGAEAEQAILASPTALGAGSEVTLTDFVFTGEALSATVNIKFADGSTARSVLEATCA